MEGRKIIKIFDTTLRDGEQTPGVHLSRSHKIEMARQLERLGVDIIEAGFPASSKGDFKAVEDISSELHVPIIAALARASHDDIDAAASALKPAANKRIHVFLASSDIHLQYKLHMTRDEALKKAIDAVEYAHTLCNDIEFSPEDAGRSDPEYLFKVIAAVINAGASTINIPDTVGYTVPPEFGRLIRSIKQNVPNIGEVTLSAHCHDDLGNATANSLSAIENGVTQIECTINGVGERAGNASLEEIIMSLYTRRDYYKCDFNINTSQLIRTSRLAASLLGIAVPPNKAVVGENAFVHEAGIHQHGILCDKRTYEIMTPETIGLTTGNLVLGKLSGKHAFSERLRELGYTIDAIGMDECFRRFKDYADKKTVSDEDIMAIVNEYLDSLSNIYELDTFQTQSGNKSKAMAMVTLSCKGVSMSEAAVGDGPIDAAFNAINRLSGADNIKLEEYSIKAVTEGTDALGEARVKISINNTSFTGRSVSTDVIESSIKAYINALNKWAVI